MKLEQAETIAQQWLTRLAPHCERIEIAGGVRRRKAEPHDIELLAIPKLIVRFDMFGNHGETISDLEAFLASLVNDGFCKPIKNGPKYKQLALPEGINLDLFIVRPETWAVQFVIRTGPADFSHWLVTPRKHGGAMPSNCKVQDGQVWQNGKALEFAEERDFLEFLGLGWIEPQSRTPLKLAAALEQELCAK